MSEVPEPVYAPRRRKQACARCHTKRIKCLGGIPCRNCSMNASPCVFPPPTKRSRTASIPMTPLLPALPPTTDQPIAESLAHFSTSATLAANYKRFEKDFASSRSSNDARATRPNYAGNPSCAHFITQFNDWSSSLKEELSRARDVLSDDLWADEFPPTSQQNDHPLEIMIESTAQQLAPSRDVKPVSIRLPPFNYSIQLIQTLEDSIAPEQHFFCRRELRSKVWNMHQNPNSQESKDQGWLCYWLAVVALGELYSAKSAGFNDQVPGFEYYHQSVALLPQIAEIHDIQYIATMCLLCMYAFSLNRLSTAYIYAGMSLRAALALKLHHDPGERPGRSHLSEIEIEHQKRLFWTVYYLDLLTTCNTASPWGVLDDEITVGYGSSANRSGDFLLEFADAEEHNQHLELMRLRSQAYSSLYGYAGTAINPFSWICLMDHDFKHPLNEQHLDKIVEFYDSLASWEAELSDQMKVTRSWDGSVMNLNRVNAHLYLTYYQTILVILRPALVMSFNICFMTNTRAASIPNVGRSSSLSLPDPRLLAILDNATSAALQVSSIASWLSEQKAFPLFCFFHTSYLVTSIVTLYIARSVATSSSIGHFPQEHHNSLALELQLLHDQAAAGNPSARDFKTKLELLDKNLQALDRPLQDPYNGDGFDLFLE